MRHFKNQNIPPLSRGGSAPFTRRDALNNGSIPGNVVVRKAGSLAESRTQIRGEKRAAANQGRGCVESMAARAGTSGAPVRSGGARAVQRDKTIHHANTRERARDGGRAGGREEGEVGRGREGRSISCGTNFPLKNGREQRARCSVGFVLRNPNPLMATTDGPATFKVSPPPDRMY